MGGANKKKPGTEKVLLGTRCLSFGGLLSAVGFYGIQEVMRIVPDPSAYQCTLWALLYTVAMEALFSKIDLFAPLLLHRFVIKFVLFNSSNERPVTLL